MKELGEQQDQRDSPGSIVTPAQGRKSPLGHCPRAQLQLKRRQEKGPVPVQMLCRALSQDGGRRSLQKEELRMEVSRLLSL